MNKVNYIHALVCRKQSLWKKRSTELVFGSLPLKLHIHTDFYCLMVNRKAISFLSLVSFCQLSVFIKCNNWLRAAKTEIFSTFIQKTFLWKSITKRYNSKEKYI